MSTHQDQQLPAAEEDLISSLRNPFLGKPIEICIVTPSLKSTLTGLVKLGIGPFKIYQFAPETVSDMTFRGEKAEFRIDVAFAEQNGMVWEVMEPVEGGSVMRDFLESTGGRGGVQHLAFDCDEGERDEELVGEGARVEAKRRRKDFQKRGFPLVQSGVWHGKKGTCEFMFFDTIGAVNTCFESYVFSDDWADPDDVEWFPCKPEDI